MANRLFVISGPSGAGKGTIVSELRSLHPEVGLSVSMTTRDPRPGDVPGVSYHFVSVEEFERLIEDDGFLEWAHVHEKYYGTPRSEVSRLLAKGSLIVEIDVQGAFQIRERMPEAVLVFIAPPDMTELRRRLVGRGTETPEQIEIRMRNAEREMEASASYDEVIVNVDISESVEELAAIIKRYENC